jgi:type II secretory ATPase GspE/PulE/Tfp pilus assembly ATPase PilB-like protein
VQKCHHLAAQYLPWAVQTPSLEMIKVSWQGAEKLGFMTEATGLERVARREGMMAMTQDGVAAFPAGLTTTNEVFA